MTKKIKDIPFDVNCRVINLPSKIRAVTLPNNDDSYDVYVNSSLSDEGQKIAFEHELIHIRNDHFYKYDTDVASCEDEANEGD